MPEFDVEITRLASAAIAAAFRELLDDKHLYQSVSVSRDSLDEYKAKIWPKH